MLKEYDIGKMTGSLIFPQYCWPVAYVNKEKQVLYFRATWYFFSGQVRPGLKELDRDYHALIEIIGIPTDKIEAVMEYVKENNIEWINSWPNKKI